MYVSAPKLTKLSVVLLISSFLFFRCAQQDDAASCHARAGRCSYVQASARKRVYVCCVLCIKVGAIRIVVKRAATRSNEFISSAVYTNNVIVYCVYWCVCCLCVVCVLCVYVWAKVNYCNYRPALTLR